jgi:hypothetical protein
MTHLIKAQYSVTSHEMNIPQSIKDGIYKDLNTFLNKIQDQKVKNTIRDLLKGSNIRFGVGSVDIKYRNLKIPGEFKLKDSKIHYIMVDVLSCVDDSDHDAAINVHDEIKALQAKINSVSTKMNEQEVQKNLELKKKVNELYKKLFDYVDFSKLIYNSYAVLITALVYRAANTKGIESIYEVSSNYFNTIISGVIKKMGVELDSEKRELLEMILDYVFASTFTTLQPKEVVENVLTLHKTRDYSKYFKGKAENRLGEPTVQERFRYLDYRKYRTIDDLNYLLAKAEIINVTPSTLKSNIEKNNTDFYTYLKSNFMYFVMYIIQKNYTVYGYELVKDDGFGARLEELVLNYKRDIIF